MEGVVDRLVARLIAGCATGLGALPLFFFRKISPRLLDGLLGAAAGVMIGFCVMMFLDNTLG